MNIDMKNTTSHQTDSRRIVRLEEKLGLLFCTDVDREGDEVIVGTFRWAGGTTGMGYLLLK